MNSNIYALQYNSWTTIHLYQPRTIDVCYWNSTDTISLRMTYSSFHLFFNLRTGLLSSINNNGDVFQLKAFQRYVTMQIFVLYPNYRTVNQYERCNTSEKNRLSRYFISRQINRTILFLHLSSLFFVIPDVVGIHHIFWTLHIHHQPSWQNNGEPFCRRSWDRKDHWKRVKIQLGERRIQNPNHSCHDSLICACYFTGVTGRPEYHTDISSENEDFFLELWADIHMGSQTDSVDAVLLLLRKVA